MSRKPGPPPLRAANPLSERVARAVPVIAVVLVASCGIVATTFVAGRAVRALARESVESTARALSLAARQVLQEQSGRAPDFERLFADRVVAYALLAEPSGKVLFHTNPELRGTVIDVADAFSALREGSTRSRRVTLGTGRPALVVDQLLASPKGPPVLLRLALHTLAADRMVARVDRLWLSVVAVVTLLWAGGGLVLVLAARSGRLRREVERREALSLVGQMTSTLAHEIRNAIGGVKGYVQLAAERTAVGDVRAANLAAALHGVERVEMLVGSLLGYAREEQYVRVAVDVGAAVANAAASASGWPGVVRVDVDPGLKVLADPEKLERVLVNAVRNAIESAGTTGEILLKAQRHGHRVVVAVEDNGTGLPAEALPKVFTPFYTTKASGTGLGLAYARKVVEGMGGEISLENRAGTRGAVLRIVLPRAGG